MKIEKFQNDLIGSYTFATLDNGLSVYLMEKEGFSSAYAVYGTRYGSTHNRFSSDGQEIEVPAGIAHFLEHKLFESEEGDTFARFAKTGAYCNAHTSFDRTCYLFSCTKNFDENLDILLDFVQHPYFTAETVAKEQGIIAQEIKMYEDNPGWRVLFNMLGVMYENHPVKIDIAGTVDSIAQIDDKLLYKCYNTFYDPSNMFICIAGNINTDKVLKQIQDAVKPSSGVDVKMAEFTEKPTLLKHYVEQQLEVSKPLFCLGFKEIFEGNRPSLKERIVAGLLLEILCGDCSELYRKLINSGIIGDEFSAEYFEGNGYAAFLIEGETEDPKLVEKEIKIEIQRLIEQGIDERLWQAVKKSAYGDAVKRFDSTDDIVTDMIDCALTGGGLFDTMSVLKEVSSQDVIDRLKVLTDDVCVLSVIYPKKG